jgi:DNA repair protein RadC
MVVISNEAAEIEVFYKPKQFTSKVKVLDSRDAHKYFMSIWSHQLYYREEMVLLLLNTANCIIGYNRLGMGSTTGVVADVKMILQIALKTNAQSIMLAHNHPSANKKASKQDIDLTNKVKASAKLMDISLLDHLILCGEEEYFSFADEGLL